VVLRLGGAGGLGGRRGDYWFRKEGHSKGVRWGGENPKIGGERRPWGQKLVS